MEIPPTTRSAAQATPAPKVQEATSNGAIASDFETFLTLLTAQMRNQDPLKPMESTEYVAQLASFSSVEQQVRTNDSLERIFDLLSGGAADGLAEWIGKEVRAPGKIDYAGQPVEAEVTPIEGAERSMLVVTNDFGQVVASQVVAPDDGMVTWDGTTDLGTAAHGRYAIRIDGYEGDRKLGTSEGRVFAPVTEVRFRDGMPVLVTEQGAEVPLAEVTALR